MDDLVGAIIGFISLTIVLIGVLFSIKNYKIEIDQSEKISDEVEFIDAYTKTEGGGIVLPETPVVIGNSTDFITVIKYENTYYEFRDKTTYYNAKSFNQENGKVYGNFAKTKNGLKLLEIVFTNDSDIEYMEDKELSVTEY